MILHHCCSLRAENCVTWAVKGQRIPCTSDALNRSTSISCQGYIPPIIHGIDIFVNLSQVLFFSLLHAYSTIFSHFYVVLEFLKDGILSLI